MKKAGIILIMTFLILSVTISCEKESIKDELGYLYTNDYIRKLISPHIEKGTIGNKHLFVINEQELKETEIRERVSSIQKEDIISITIINKTEAVKEYSSSANDGVVKINYYIDDLLKPDYYTSSNTFVMDVINDLINQKKVSKYPLIVLGGKPLRGKEIKESLDNLNNSTIKEVLAMKLKAGLQLYGERAINGVVLINL